MLQGFYSAASGMLMQQRALDVIANNLSNTQTPGYKTNRLLSSTFEQTLMTRLEHGKYSDVGSGSPVRIVSQVADLYTNGGLTETSRPFDMAITGAGFFNIQGDVDGQTYLTRDGQFDLDDEGYLILRGQGRVLGTGGPMQISTSDITVSETGEITDSVTGAVLGQLAITAPNEDAVVEEQYNGMYQVTAGGTTAVAQPGIVQGALEDSNVSLTNEMTAMITAQRNFSSASQALQFIDATYAKAVNIASL